jgi:hypothetical protein
MTFEIPRLEDLDKLWPESQPFVDGLVSCYCAGNWKNAQLLFNEAVADFLRIGMVGWQAIREAVQEMSFELAVADCF